MQSTPPIRRYVIVRRRGRDGSTAWSMEPLAPSTHRKPPAPAAAPRPEPRGARAA
ncbi:hypothetical protein [Conexibacter arvalis]|uniref:Uncharacterized protein n=1 Tax=Conexibacter arvalis TaxID=912552 RepID=A0A840IKU7_9ACTN|nr:hypothetical protein [Conexibacter arvalis]MBB4664945.1 hypothetical protein [Conexibacter arvalis]